MRGPDLPKPRRVGWKLALVAAALAAVPAVWISAFGRPDPAQAAHEAPLQGADLRRLEKLERELAFLKGQRSDTSGASALDAERRIEQLRQEVLNLQRQLQAARDASQGRHGSDEDASNGIDPVLAEHADRMRAARLTAFLEGELARQAVDETWSPAAQSEVLGVVQAPEHRSTRLRAVSCHETLCRIEAGHDNREAESSFVRKLGRLEAFRDAEAFIERLDADDGSVETRIFVSRTGHHLPPPPEGT